MRLADINTPELEFCYGEEAKDRLEELVGGKRVKLSEIFRGSHERSIALVHVGDKLINEVMAREGYGRVTSTYTTQAKHLREEGDIARQGKIGLYSEVCSQKVTPDPKCAIKVNINQAGSSKDLYVSWVWCILRHYCAARY
ncbi:thermonuclease family protein [Candidatus Microgenomates bacterium]|nr:thermonuclease family protein [Candidatus Microgenomates bacterium]